MDTQLLELYEAQLQAISKFTGIEPQALIFVKNWSHVKRSPNRAITAASICSLINQKPSTLIRNEPSLDEFPIEAHETLVQLSNPRQLKDFVTYSNLRKALSKKLSQSELQ